MGKIVSKDEFRGIIRKEIKKNNKSIVLCHGVFDLVHPGHIIHLEQAKAMGDILVVSVTAAQYVRKGPDRPYFCDDMRLKVLSAISYVDYVMLSDGYTADDIIESVEPDIYVKGEEYKRASDDITGKISEEQELVEKHGGRICYTSGQTYSSTKLINTAMSALSDEVREYVKKIKGRYSMGDIVKWAKQAENLKILVVGDVIIDKYSYCHIRGMMSKDMGYSASLNSSEEYLGGAVAIARHLASFSEHVTLMSIMGDEEELHKRIEEDLSNQMQLELIQSKVVPTIVKHRYLTRNQKREEYKKIFAINNIPDKVGFDEESIKEFQKRLSENIHKYDVVFLCDFGHGLINQQIGELIQSKAKFLALNCQTNSSNYGLNIITKYHRADVFSLDEKELKLAYPEYAFDEKSAMLILYEQLNGQGWLTKGAQGASCIQKGEISLCPAFTLDVKDTIGAGDAFFAMAGLFVAAGASIEMGMFMGNIGGAIGANMVGNKEAIEKVNVLKYASTLLNI